MKQRLSGAKGQATVEFAFIVLIFFAFLFALFDMARICYNWSALQYSVNEGSRFGSIGNRNTAAISAQVNATAASLRIPAPAIQILDFNNVPIVNQGSNPLVFFKLRADNVVNLNPVSAMMLALMGNRGGIYNVRAETVIRNEP